LRHSTVFLKESISASARVLRQAGAWAATRITLVTIGSFVLLATAGVIVVVVFRRQTALLTDTQTTPSSPVTGKMVFLGSPNSPPSPTADLAESEVAHSNPVTEENPCLSENKGDHESTFPESPYLPAAIEECSEENQ
jgi:hypothetical protein